MSGTGPKPRKPLVRKTPLPRGAAPQRGQPLKSAPPVAGKGPRTPVRTVNAPRRAKAFQAAYGGTERVSFVSALPCAACRMGPCENAHYDTGGMGLKSPASHVLPLCAGPHGCHATLHRIGRESFEKFAKIDLAVEAARTERLWQAHLGQTP